MKNTLIAVLFLCICFIAACTKETGNLSNTPALQGNAANSSYIFGHSAARYAGSDYSQSIPSDVANSLVQSYVTSLPYPGINSALRTFNLDADTLRAYLQSHPEVGTLKFMLAHQTAYKNSGDYGKYAGMSATAMTMIVIGMNDNYSYVLNNRREVYQQTSISPYMQSIPIDTANSMIKSYLTSVNYPEMDTAIRSFNFDADTVRAYLNSHTSIVTVKFMFAHQPTYISSGNYGKYSGMNPNAMTMVIVGLNSNNEYVLSSTNGMYDHFRPCPNFCHVNATPLIQ